MPTLDNTTDELRDNKMSGSNIVAALEKLKTDRSNLREQFEEAAAYCLPASLRVVSETEMDITTNNRERKKSNVVIDDMRRANRIHAGGLYANLCPPDLKWFALEDVSLDAQQSLPSNRIMSTISQLLFDMLMLGNFNSEIQTAFMCLGTYGTMCMYFERDEKSHFRFENQPINEIYIQENARKKVDVVYREFVLTSRQAVQKFNEPGDNLSEKIMNEGTSPSPVNNNKKHIFIHYVCPNMDIKYNSKGIPEPGNKNLPFKSYYVCKSDKEIIRESGYHEFPYLVARYQKGSLYGCAPAEYCLKTAKRLNALWIKIFKAADKIIDPPVSLDTQSYFRSGIKPQFNNNPGSINLYDGRTGKPPEYAPPPAQVQIGEPMTQKLSTEINEEFYVDKFLAINTINQQQHQEKTAFEIRQLKDEKTAMIMGVVSNLLDEFFTPLINSIFSMAYRYKDLPPLPPNEAPVNIKFVSPLALAAQNVELNNFLQVIQIIEPYAQQNPSILDFVNWDNAILRMFEVNNIPPDYYRTQADVDELRKQQQEQMEQQQQQQIALEASKNPNMYKNVEPNSPLAQNLNQ